MSDVWVKLDRDRAAKWIEKDRPFERQEIAESIAAALSEPSEDRVEKVAKAIYGDETGLPWVYFDDEPGWNQEVYRKHAHAALAVLFGEGDTNG